MNNIRHKINNAANLGNAIKEQRNYLKLTQKEVGARVGIDQANISVIENGSPGTQLDTLLHLLSALDLELIVQAKDKSKGAW